ncbi:thioredoxin family protein [Acinetobacter baumannii]|uniref:thioredoxin family protein n=1 Tax=Acinetobacter baumannii TaxID=470 RepID=UPI0011260976|nr:thioredoxin family protein [Acinetobacter baumannii]TPT32337.1 thioredoxin family protein [Acinetobacter baumannii]HCW3876356.1 thioredoxin family protein [Acinetobacter baumannii]HCW3904117.1 thioredoxin family protein [Acinetobacter baumannii]HCW4986014.1 thioredoxin family protein [Acinetobacter baumannii]
MTNRSKKVVTKDTVDAHEFASEASETVAEQIVQAEVVERSESEPAQTKCTLTLYSSTVCSPCKTIKPILEKQMLGRATEYHVLTIDPNNIEPEIKQQFEEAGVTQVPTLICKEDGKEVGRLSGYSGVRPLLDVLKAWEVI